MSEDNHTVEFLVAHGMLPHSPEELNESLQAVIDAMPASLYGDPRQELTQAELKALEAGGVDLDAKVKRDPVAEAAVRFAAVIETSLTTAEAAAQLNVPESQIRQMIARRTLYSVLLDNRRYIPAFQFDSSGSLVPNITKVSPALPGDLHPLDVVDWYTQPDPDLFLGDDDEIPLSPVEWLRSGGSFERVTAIARTL